MNIAQPRSNSTPGLPTVGVVGGGQLARMLAAPAAAMGVRLRLLCTHADDSAAQVIPEVTLGAENDLETLRRFADACDVLTFDHEQVPTPHLEALEADGVLVRPGSAALQHAQDKILLRERVQALGLPQPAWRPVTSPEQVVEFAAQHSLPVVVKSARGGYDGKGVWKVTEPGHLEQVWMQAKASGQPLLVEQHVGFTRELAAQLARRPNGQIEVFPVVETVQKDGICHQVFAPAPDLDPAWVQASTNLAITLAQTLDVVGMFTVELFDTGNAEQPVLINELAMRPHNSGHWSIDGASVSQFEQHLRAVLDWPLAPVHPMHQATAMVNLLGAEELQLAGLPSRIWQFHPAAKVHLYGKTVKPGRKVGHVTLCVNSVTQLRSQCEDLSTSMVSTLAPSAPLTNQ